VTRPTTSVWCPCSLVRYVKFEVEEEAISTSSLIVFFRSLSFGGLLFAGVGALVAFRFPELAQGHPYVFMLACGLVGASLERVIAKVANFIFGPMGRLLSFYESLLELGILRTQGAIDEKAHHELVQKLCEKRFIK
jgi:hypothetical protein